MTQAFVIATIFHPRFHSRGNHEQLEKSFSRKLNWKNILNLKNVVVAASWEKYFNALFEYSEMLSSTIFFFFTETICGKRSSAFTSLKETSYIVIEALPAFVKIYKTWSRVSTDVFGSLSLFFFLLFFSLIGRRNVEIL